MPGGACMAGVCACLGGVHGEGCACPGVCVPRRHTWPRMPRPPPCDRHNACITLPQTLFAGGNNICGTFHILHSAIILYLLDSLSSNAFVLLSNASVLLSNASVSR